MPSLLRCWRIADVLAAGLLLSWAAAAAAVEPDEVLADPALETRAREIGKELRCLVCQNQSIDDSSADLARDLRVVVRERLAAGDSDAEVLQYVADRYGDFVLLRPPVKPATYPLWVAPPLLLLLGIAFAAAYLRRHRRGEPAATAPLTPEEQARLDRLLAPGTEKQ
jgi:cytochrome c-type biogenesis protein CcmH